MKWFTLSYCLLVALTACGRDVGGGPTDSLPSTPAAQTCDPAYPLPDLNVGSEIAHLKTAANVVELTSPCTVRVVIAGGAGTLSSFTNKTITLRATSRTTYADGNAAGATRLGALGLKPADTFTLSFDSRPFPDDTYPLNFINR
jgi:hypothetical protein